MIKVEPIANVISDTVFGKYRIIIKKSEQLVGARKVISKTETKIWNEHYDMFNEDAIEKNIRTLTTDEVRDAYSDIYLGKRTTVKHEIFGLNDGVNEPTRNKKVLVKKTVIRESPNHKTTTHYGYGTGYRSRKIDHTSGDATFNYSIENGMPKLL